MAYAAVLSLQLAMRDLLSISESKKLISGLDMTLINQQFDYLDSFLETIYTLPSNKIADAEASERRVRDAARHLHDLIDFRLSDQLLVSESISTADDDEITPFTSLFSQQLPILKQELSSFLTALETTEDQQQQQQQQWRYCSTFSSSDYNTGKQQNLVGLDEQIKILKEWTLRPRTYLSCTTVVGMTGIGKTTLVKHVYNDPDVVEEFETRLFVHIGPHCHRYEDILLLVLNQLGVVVPSDKPLLHEDIDFLEHQLSEALSSTKYLLVFEDVWNNDIILTRQQKHMGFPDKEVGSRIIVISHIHSTDDDMLLPLLKEEDSWKLLYQTAFTREEKCSSELEKIGKKIARNCDGLPAAIIQVGENLRGKSIQEWKTISEKEDPLVITRDDDTPLSKAVYFSYTMLPQFLKVMFLYMGVFPKNYEISVSMLVKLWISEGLLHSNWEFIEAETLAVLNLNQLVCQLVVLRENKASVSRDKTKKCRLHFTFRSLCVNEAKSEKIFHILKKYTDCTPENMTGQQRLCVHNNVVLALEEVHEWMESVPNARSLLCFGPKQKYPIVLPLCFRLLKVLDALAIRFYEFPHQLLALFHLRYLTITCDRELPNSVSRLENLEVLILGRHHNIKLSYDPVYLPIDIWNMHKLKQLYCMGFDLPTPPTDEPHLVLEKLLTLSGVSVHSCTMDVLSRIPMLTRVAVQIESAHDAIETFSFFDHFASRYEQFESFKCVVINPNMRSQVIHCVPNFPVNITKICLSGCGFPWKKIGAIAALPDLKVLKLQWCAFSGPEWETSQTAFPWLHFLLLEDLDIEHWKFDGVFFPVLNHVIIRHCYRLKNIPDQLKFVDVLEVDDCGLAFVEKMRKWKNTSRAEAKIHSSSDS